MSQELRDKIDKAGEMVSALCKPRGSAGAREWMMSIPARRDYDPDLVIGDGLLAGLEALKALDASEKVRREVAEAIVREAGKSRAWSVAEAYEHRDRLKAIAARLLEGLGAEKPRLPQNTVFKGNEVPEGLGAE